METLRNLASTILIIALIFASAFYLGMHHERGNWESIEPDVLIDTTYITEIQYDTDTLLIPPGPVDTGRVVEEYFKRKTFDTTIVAVTPNSELKIKFTGSLYQNNLSDVVLQTSSGFSRPELKPKNWSVSMGAIAGLETFMPLAGIKYKRHELMVGRNLLQQNGWYIGYKMTLLEF